MITKKTAIRSKAKGEPGKDDQVRIHNRFAGRPLMFRIPGESIRLGPGESATVSKDSLNCHELRGLCASGLIVVEESTRRKRGRPKRSDPISKPVHEGRRASPAKSEASPTSDSKKPRGSVSKASSRGTSGRDR